MQLLDINNNFLRVAYKCLYGFMGLTRTEQGVNVTCSRPQRTAIRSGLEPRTPWSVVRDAYHCTSPHPHLCLCKETLLNKMAAKLVWRRYSNDVMTSYHVSMLREKCRE